MYFRTGLAETAITNRTVSGESRSMTVLIDASISAANPKGLWIHLQRIWRRRETIRYLYQSNLKAGHRDKLLGHVWCLLDPLLFIGVYYLVFGVLFQQRAQGKPGSFLIYLVIGVLAWRFFEGTINQSTLSVRGHRGLIHAVSFPKAVVPISISLSRLYDFLWGLVAFGLILLVVGTTWSLQLLWVPVLILVQLCFVLGGAFIIAYLGAFYADTSNIVSAGMRFWFYCSPIFYYATTQPDGTPGMIPAKYTQYELYYRLNPMASLLECYRSVIVYGMAPELWQLLYVIVLAVVMLVVGFIVFTRGEGEFSKYV